MSAAPGHVDGVDTTCAHCTVQNQSGAVYTRWGKSSCPANATMQYTGYLVTRQGADQSGASDFLRKTWLSWHAWRRRDVGH